MWTHFWDMCSGGGQKEKFAHCYIEAPQAKAEIIFYNRFGHNPNRVTCTCCGNDYSISEGKFLAQLTAYQRHCAYDNEKRKYVEKMDPIYKKYGNKHISLKDYLKQADVCVIRKKDIKAEDKEGELPEQGYVWVD